MTRALDLNLARQALDAAMRGAIERRAAVGISVVDGRGDLVAMLRMDGAPWYTVAVSRGKAAAAAAFGKPSGELAPRADMPAFRMLQHEDGLVAQQGAVPIRVAGRVVGAIGVSGATSELDEQIAIDGASAVQVQEAS
ncbi:heme-binding protein [Arenibaculum sp.]|uniref:GlcG/HbpS family heme-binding protein n=1 Tax=Arenibaculum sp. TaxID=2865862 RepID=UPI002E1261B2|nr:heme-binding protein [Arenibaculum sp.]